MITLASQARDENVPAKRINFFIRKFEFLKKIIKIFKKLISKYLPATTVAKRTEIRRINSRIILAGLKNSKRYFL